MAGVFTNLASSLSLNSSPCHSYVVICGMYDMVGHSTPEDSFQIVFESVSSNFILQKRKIFFPLKK